MAAKPKKNGHRAERVNISFQPGALVTLDEKAKKLGMNRSQTVALAVYRLNPKDILVERLSRK